MQCRTSLRQIRSTTASVRRFRSSAFQRPILTTWRATAYKLTCAEAIAAALYITGHDAHADLLMSKFSWGHSFWKVNG